MPEPGSPPPFPAAGSLSLTDLFRSEESALLRYAYGLTSRRAIAEEIVQDVFLQLHRHWDEVNNPRAWLYRSVRNRSLNHLRDHRREVFSDSDHSPEPTTQTTPHTDLRRLEAAGHLRLLVAELGESDRELLRLKYDEDLKYREIAERTGLSVSNVGYKLHHILKLLAAKLHQLGIDSADDSPSLP